MTDSALTGVIILSLILGYYLLSQYLYMKQEKNRQYFELEKIKLQYPRERDEQIQKIKDVLSDLDEFEQTDKIIELSRNLKELITALEVSRYKPRSRKITSTLESIKNILETGGNLSTLAVNIKAIVDWFMK